MEQIASGLEGVVVAATRLSEVDGERGRLIIGGYPVEELAPHAHFEEVLFLLWHGRLPSPAERTALAEALAARRALPESTQALLVDGARRAVPAMDALRMGIASLSLTAHDGTDREAVLDDAITLVAAIPTAIATYWRHREGRGVPPLRADLGHVAHYLWLLDGREADPAVVRALETYCNTVVDHGMRLTHGRPAAWSASRYRLLLAYSTAHAAPVRVATVAPGPSAPTVDLLDREHRPVSPVGSGLRSEGSSFVVCG